jgi:hypothetical protein
MCVCLCSVKNLLSGARQSPVAAALEALMDGKQVWATTTPSPPTTPCCVNVVTGRQNLCLKFQPCCVLVLQQTQQRLIAGCITAGSCCLPVVRADGNLCSIMVLLSSERAVHNITLPAAIVQGTAEFDTFAVMDPKLPPGRTGDAVPMICPLCRPNDIACEVATAVTLTSFSRLKCLNDC